MQNPHYRGHYFKSVPVAPPGVDSLQYTRLLLRSEIYVTYIIHLTWRHDEFLQFSVQHSNSQTSSAVASVLLSGVFLSGSCSGDRFSEVPRFSKDV